MATNCVISSAQHVRIAAASSHAAHARVSVAPRMTSKSSVFLAGRACGMTSTSGEQNGRGQLQIVAAKGKSMGRKIPGKGQQSGADMSLPPLDPDNPQFMIYVRSKAVPQWYPVSVVTGGSAAKGLIKMAEGNIGSQFGSDALTRNVGSVIYKDEAQIRSLVIRQYPLLKKAKQLEWGYKILDPEVDAKKQLMSFSNVIKIPEQSELKAPVEKAADKVKSFFGGLGGSKPADTTPKAP